MFKRGFNNNINFAQQQNQQRLKFTVTLNQTTTAEAIECQDTQMMEGTEGMDKRCLIVQGEVLSGKVAPRKFRLAVKTQLTAEGTTPSSNDGIG
jgi:hypothetical protein